MALKNYSGLKVVLNNPAVAKLVVWYYKDRNEDLMYVDLVALAPGDANLEARRDGAVVTFIQVHISPSADANATYVDDFSNAYYNLGFWRDGGNLSKWLVLEYRDSVAIALNLDSINDIAVPAQGGRDPQGKSTIGAGGRRFPMQMNRTTTPKLCAAKGRALADMQANYADFLEAAQPGIIFVIGISPFVAPLGGSLKTPVNTPKRVQRSSLPRPVQQALTEEENLVAGAQRGQGAPETPLLPQRGTRQKPTFDWRLVPKEKPDRAGMEHVMLEHAPWRQNPNKSKFKQPAWNDLQRLAEQTVEDGTVGTLLPDDVTGAPQAGVVYELRFPTPVGESPKGADLYRIRIVLDANNHVTTMFPR